MISEYSVMKEFQDSNPRHMMAFARSPKGASESTYMYMYMYMYVYMFYVFSILHVDSIVQEI